MKIIRFRTDSAAEIKFGAVIRDCAVSFTAIAKIMKESVEGLADSRQYLAGLPATQVKAEQFVTWGEENLDQVEDADRLPLSQVHLETPVEVTSLFDFGLTPRHLKNSIGTLKKYEEGNPQTSFLLQMFDQVASQKKPAPEDGKPEQLAHYKCNMNAIVGSGVTVPWPVYTEYLDIEPELAVIYGNEDQPVAGYSIFNDISARDVQVPEFIGGFCLSKDVARGNQIGPFLVTPDEAGDVFAQKVTVEVNGSLKFQGSTSEISHGPDAMFAWLAYITPLRSGSVLGFGTIPDCTGLDLDDFLSPGDEVVITFEHLGTLCCKFGVPENRVFPSRWPGRSELDIYRRPA